MVPLVTGKQPLIPDEMTSCLFPKEVVGLGVDDSMDCFTLINVVSSIQVNLKFVFLSAIFY